MKAKRATEDDSADPFAKSELIVAANATAFHAKVVKGTNKTWHYWGCDHRA